MNSKTIVIFTILWLLVITISACRTELPDKHVKRDPVLPAKCLFLHQRPAYHLLEGSYDEGSIKEAVAHRYGTTSGDVTVFRAASLKDTWSVGWATSEPDYGEIAYWAPLTEGKIEMVIAAPYPVPYPVIKPEVILRCLGEPGRNIVAPFSLPYHVLADIVVLVYPQRLQVLRLVVPRGEDWRSADTDTRFLQLITSTTEAFEYRASQE